MPKVPNHYKLANMALDGEDVRGALFTACVVGMYPLSWLTYVVGAVILFNEIDPDISARRKIAVRCTYPILGPILVGLGLACLAVSLPILIASLIGGLLAYPAWWTHERSAKKAEVDSTDKYLIVASEVSLAGVWLSKGLTNVLNRIFKRFWTKLDTDLHSLDEEFLFPSEPVDALHAIPRTVAAVALSPIILGVFIAGAALSLALLPLVWLGAGIKTLGNAVKNKLTRNNAVGPAPEGTEERSDDVTQEAGLDIIKKGKKQIRQLDPSARSSEETISSSRAGSSSGRTPSPSIEKDKGAVTQSASSSWGSWSN